MAQNNTRPNGGKRMQLTVRDVPVDIHKALQQRAKATGRSMNAEALSILRRSLARSQAA